MLKQLAPLICLDGYGAGVLVVLLPEHLLHKLLHIAAGASLLQALLSHIEQLLQPVTPQLTVSRAIKATRASHMPSLMHSHRLWGQRMRSRLVQH